MNYQQQLNAIKKETQEAKSLVILLPQNPTLDATAAALALFLGLKNVDKKPIIASPTQMRVEFSKLVGIDKIANSVGNKNLVVSFNYKEDSIEKVSYNVENEKFNLVIQPRTGFPTLNKDNVEFSYEGLDADLVFVIGAKKLDELGEVYEKERHALNNTSIVNISASTTNAKFGKINLVESRGTTLSEIIFNLLSLLNIKINQDIAGNLLQGIEAQTQNLQSPFTSPQTFEIVAELMKAGAKRSVKPALPTRPWSQGQQSAGFGRQTPASLTPRPWVPQQQASPPPTSGMGQTTSSPSMPMGQQFPQQQSAPPPFSQMTPPVQQQPEDKQAAKRSNKTHQKSRSGRKKSHHVLQSHQLKQNLPKNIPSQDQNTQSSNNKPRKDWLQPKIYQGKTKV